MAYQNHALHARVSHLALPTRIKTRQHNYAQPPSSPPPFPLPSRILKPNPNNPKEHILQHMHHDRRARRQQLRPPPQIAPPIPRHILPIHLPHDPPHHPRRQDLTHPSHGRQSYRAVEVIQSLAAIARSPPDPAAVVLAVEREVRIHVSVAAEVQHEDLAQEGRHGHVLAQRPDEDGAPAELGVGGVGLRVQAQEGEEGVPERRHGEGMEDDEGGGGQELKEHELLGRAETGV